MLRKIIFTILCLSLGAGIQAQDLYSLKSGKVYFFAGTPMEDIEATNTKAMSFLNIKTGQVAISIPNNEFHFKKALMEEHFNENYMESAKFPKDEFKGKIINIDTCDFTKTKPFIVSVQGTLTIHGVTKPRTIEVKIKNNNGVLEAESKFQISLVDHNIERPKILWEKIAEKVDVTVNFTYEIFKK